MEAYCVKCRSKREIKNPEKITMKNGKPAIEEPQIRRRLVRAETKVEAMRLNGLRFLTKQLKGEPLGSETSINKLQRANLEWRRAELSLELLGSESQHEGTWQQSSLSFHGSVIGGGTPNIQRNIIAERVLGLPKD